MENYLKLTLTDLGQKTMLRLIKIGKKPGLKVGVSHVKEKFLGNELDLSVKFQILPEAKITLQDDEEKLHIQAFLASASSYDIYQIGLFLEMADEKDKLILLAAYYSEELIAKKLAKQEMVLDIIVGLATFKADDFTLAIKDVSPLFSMPPATYERYGSVRLAAVKDIETSLQDSELVLSTTLLADQAVIENKRPGFILTTNHLDSLFARPDNSMQTFKPVLLYADTTAIEEKIRTISFFSSYCDDKFIYLFIPIETVTGKRKLLLSLYDVTAKAVKNAFEIEDVSSLFQENNVLQTGLFCSYNEKHGVDYYFFTKKADNLLRKLTVQIEDENLNIKLMSGKPNAITIGQSFLYNRKLFNIVAKSSKEIIMSFFKKNLERHGSLILPYTGTAVFAEAIQDKVYCIAMTDEAKLSPRVAIYEFMDDDSEPTFTYLPPPSTPFDFESFAANNSILLSCQLDGAIYFFSLESEKAVLKSDYYQYDVLNNHWLKWQFQGNPVTLSGTSVQASLAKRGKEIYLCVTSLDQSKSVVSIIRLNGEF